MARTDGRTVFYSEYIYGVNTYFSDANLGRDPGMPAGWTEKFWDLRPLSYSAQKSRSPDDSDKFIEDFQHITLMFSL